MAEQSTAQTKVCNKCNEEKPVSEFHPYNKGGNTLRPTCKDCGLADGREWRAANLEKVREASRQARLRNIDAAREYDRKRSKEKNIRSREYKAAYFQANKERLMKRKAEREKARRHADPIYRFMHNMRKSIWSASIGKSTSKAIKALGYSSDELRSHLERQFVRGMSWDNYGTHWHVDHIRPIASFDLSDPDQFRECWNLPNLRPLKAMENMRKNANQTHLI